MDITGLTFETDNLRVFGDGVSTARITVQCVRLIVIAAKNVIERVAAEAGQCDLSVTFHIFHIMLLVDVILGHDAATQGSTR